MGTLAQLRAQAISAAKQFDWQSAVTANETILEQVPADLSALNRLGMALGQLNQTAQAVEVFTRVLSLDATNIIAKKQLEQLKNNKKVVPPSFSACFIEEPGKTKILQLHRLSGRQLLETLSIGQKCLLKPKTRFISVETLDGQYIGALPDDISSRLAKLIATGNKYNCLIHTVNATDCHVFIQEMFKSKVNATLHSFPIGKANHSGDDNEAGTSVLLGEDDDPSQKAGEFEDLEGEFEDAEDTDSRIREEDLESLA